MGRVDDTEGIDSVSIVSLAGTHHDAPTWSVRVHTQKKNKKVTHAPFNFPFNSHFDFPPFRRTVLQSGSPYSLATLQCDALALPVTH